MPDLAGNPNMLARDHDEDDTIWQIFIVERSSEILVVQQTLSDW